MKYYGQFEDDKIIESYFKQNYIGGCIDIGATNGVHINNTKYFEEKGWYCLCVEPNPKSYEQLKINRKNTLNLAVSNYNKNLVDFTIVCLNDNSIIENEGAISSLSIDENLYNDHIKAGFKLTTTDIKVSVRTLDYCIEKYYQYPKIDFLSIDTEGTELDVLKGFSLNEWNPTLIVVENNYNDPKIENYLKEFNYIKDKREGVNDYYIKMKTQKFILGPKLGDFIHSLYAVKCLSGDSKSDIYLKENDFKFSKSITETYKDIYPIVKKLPYINDIFIYDGTVKDCIDINFRNANFLFKNNWYDIYKHLFNLTDKYENEPWLPHINELENDVDDYKEIVVIHCSIERYHSGYDEILLNIINNNECLFVSNNYNEYVRFKFNHLVEFKQCEFSELYSIIQSCKFFVGNQSMPLALAHGLFKPQLGLLIYTDSIHYKDSFNENYFWIDERKRTSDNFNRINDFIKIDVKDTSIIKNIEIEKFIFKITYDKPENKVFINCNGKIEAYIIIYEYDINTNETHLIYSAPTAYDNCTVFYSPSSTKLMNLSHIKVELIYDEKIIKEEIVEIL